MLCSLIIAGGNGTRLWPKSTNKKPKQFLSLVNEKTMLQLTFERMLKIMSVERIFVLISEEYIELVKKQIPNILEKNIIIQPEMKNTAPCILLSTMYISQIYDNANIIVLPSDHMIENTTEFCNVLLRANNFINEENKNSIITIGIMPDRPESGYGYIRYNKNNINHSIVKVEQFVEKPTTEIAKKYLEEENYLWNAGIFVFNSNYILKEFSEKYSNTYNLFKTLPNIIDKSYKEKVKQVYAKAEEISIDYAIMEKSDSIYVIPSDFGWDDIGSWLALKKYIKFDENENFTNGNVRIINSNRNVVYAENKEIILLDVDDIFCIDSDDVIVIGKKEKLNEIHLLRNK